MTGGRPHERGHGLAVNWLNARETAAYLGLPSVAALYKRVERRQVPHHRWGHQLRFLAYELDALMEPRAATPSVSRVVSDPVCPVADRGDR